ncbi:hypothetical protein BC832DRAFT_427611 [Gaertneriomyces semiglobifer]|nr:hypothetical protein BC832DRAFT_427611 [Gaertneriomyces semiglobifer]
MCLRLFEFRGGLLLAAGYESGTVTIWDIQKRRMLWKEKLHDEPVLSLDVDIDLGVGVSGGADTKLVQFNLMPGEGETSVLRTANLKEQGVAAVRIRPDGKIAVSGGWDSKYANLVVTLCLSAVLRLTQQVTCIWAQEVQATRCSAGSSPGNPVHCVSAPSNNRLGSGGGCCAS